MENISLMLAFSAGLLSFLSPCVLPLVPSYLSFIAGSTITDINDSRSKVKLMYRSFGFIIGFTIIFMIMGVSISSLSKHFITYQSIIRKVGGILIIIFGLHTVGLFRINQLFFEKRLLPFGKFNSSFSAVLIGMAFATGWTPCIGPILSSILIYAGSMDTIGKGVMLLLIYSLGFAVPFLLAAFTIGEISKYIAKFSKYLSVIPIISGLILIIMGVLVLTDKLSLFSKLIL